MKMKNKFLILLFLIIPFNAFSYNSDDIININYIWTATKEDILIIPEWKDLIINYLYSNTSTGQLIIFDNNILKSNINFFQNEYKINIIIKDLLQLQDLNANNNFFINWLLVNEGENIKNIIEEQEYWINKPVFNEDIIKEIYLYEVVIMVFIINFMFFMRLLWIVRKKQAFKRYK